MFLLRMKYKLHLKSIIYLPLDKLERVVWWYTFGANSPVNSTSCILSLYSVSLIINFKLIVYFAFSSCLLTLPK